MSEQLSVPISRPTLDESGRTLAPPLDEGTNGWDAVVALAADRVNSTFRDQYLQEDPTGPARQLRFAMETDDEEGTLHVVDLTLGPPEISFPPGLGAQQAHASMFLVKGMLASVDPYLQRVNSLIEVLPNQAEITGAVALSAVHGSMDPEGVVSLDLDRGSYTPAIGGVTPLLATRLGDEIATWFRLNEVRYPLGSLLFDGDRIPAPLIPRHFDVATQPILGQPGAVLLLINTTSTTPGLVGPLGYNPLPADSTAAVIVSGRLVFGSLLGPHLEKAFQAYGTKFHGVAGDGTLYTTGTGGYFNFGVIVGSVVRSDRRDNGCQGSDLLLPIKDLRAVVRNGSIGLSWIQPWTQGFSYFKPREKTKPECTFGDFPMTLELNLTSTPVVVEPSQEVVFRNVTPSATVTFKDPSWWDVWIKDGYARQLIANEIKLGVEAKLTELFSSLELPDISVFALSNLLWPAEHRLQLKRAEIGNDVKVYGDLRPTVAVGPARVDLHPGESHRFTAVVPGLTDQRVVWAVVSGPGTVAADGTYLAPELPDGVATAAVVVATSAVDTSLAGAGMALVYRSPGSAGVEIEPQRVTLGPGGMVKLTAVVAGETNQDVTWSVSPALGTIQPTTGVAAARYAAPRTATEVHQVTVTATSTKNPAKHGSAVISVVPAVDVAIEPPTAQLGPGGSVGLSATVAGAPGPEVDWYLYPAIGEIAADGTYTAPDGVPSTTHVAVVGLVAGTPGDRSMLGAGTSWLTLVPSRRATAGPCDCP